MAELEYLGGASASAVPLGTGNIWASDSEADLVEFAKKLMKRSILVALGRRDFALMESRELTAESRSSPTTPGSDPSSPSPHPPCSEMLPGTPAY